MNYEAHSNDDYGGGGFMASQGGGGNSQSTRSRDQQSFLSLTIKQIITSFNANDDNEDTIIVDGRDLTTISIIGLIQNITPHSTNINFQIDDGTAVLDAKYFIRGEDAEFSQHEISKLIDGLYVHVVGNLRTFQGKLSMTCFTVTPIEDFNAVTHHFLNAIYLHGLANQKVTNKNDTGHISGFEMDTKATIAMDIDDPMDGIFTEDQRLILSVLTKENCERGVSVDQILPYVRGRMDMNTLRDALEFLTEEGHVYSTIDENHFKRT